MGAYAIVYMDMNTGRRTVLPERFQNPIEAQDRVRELSQASSQPSYLVQFIPASHPPQAASAF